jgi:hypothetical protein
MGEENLIGKRNAGGIGPECWLKRVAGVEERDPPDGVEIGRLEEETRTVDK